MAEIVLWENMGVESRDSPANWPFVRRTALICFLATGSLTYVFMFSVSTRYPYSGSSASR